MSGQQIKLAGVLMVALSVFCLPGCEKYALDRQMEELCKQDGGVKVYETVALPPEMFDKWGDPFPGWRGRKPEERLGTDYLYKFEITYPKQGDPLKGEGRLQRYHISIYRRSDNKLLGESVSYGRSGGDFIAYAHPTSNHCPKDVNESDFVRFVFLNKGI